MRALLLCMLLAMAGAGAQAQIPSRASGGSSLTELFESENMAASRGDYSSSIAKSILLYDAGVHEAEE